MQLLENQQNSYPVYVSSKYIPEKFSDLAIGMGSLSFVICFRNTITKGKML